MALIGPRGVHISLDSYNTTTPATPPSTVSGNLITPPKQINAGEKLIGPRKSSSINRDSYRE